MTHIKLMTSVQRLVEQSGTSSSLPIVSREEQIVYEIKSGSCTIESEHYGLCEMKCSAGGHVLPRNPVFINSNQKIWSMRVDQGEFLKQIDPVYLGHVCMSS